MPSACYPEGIHRVDAAQEKLRLAALDSYEIMDTPPEPGFDRITALAAHLLDVPVALLCLVGADRMYFKSRHGTELSEAPRQAGFCHLAVEAPGTLVIADTLAEPAHAGNPMVAGPPHVRFYAGTPLRAAGGQAIGTLCVLDTEPHPAPDAEALRILDDLAATMVALLDARLRERQLAAAGRTARLHAELLRLSFEAPDWPTMIRAVLARICAANGARAGSVWRLLPDGHVRMAEYHVAGPPLPASFIDWCRTARPPAEATLMGQAMRQERRFALDFAQADLTGMPVLQASRDVGMRAILVQPVSLGERRFVITVLFEQTPPDLQALGDGLFDLVDALRPAMFRHVAEEQQHLLGAALDAASDSVLIVQAGPPAEGEPRILYASAAASRVTGWTRSEIVGATASRFVGPETDRRQLAAIRAATRAGRSIRTELLGHRKDGSQVWVETEISTLADAGGVPTHWIAIQRDITRRRAEERAMAERNRAFRLIFEDNPLPICIFEQDSLRFVEVNAAALRQYGWSRAEFLTLGVADLHPPEQRAEVPSMVAACGDAYRHFGPLSHVTRTGEVLQVQIASQPIQLQGRRARIAVVTDITELRAAQEALLQSERLSTIGQITGGVAHDFNNLLTVVMLNLGDALAEVPAGSALHGMLDSALYAASRGAELTSQLLSYARRQTLRPQVIGLHEQLGRLVPLLRRALAGRHELQTAFADTEATVNVDPAQLENAVMNLVLNARDALPDGGRITLGVARRTLDRPLPALPDPIAPGRYALVFVEDGGRGIPELALRRVFDPFFTTKQAGEGSGLGLSMVYGFARQSGGHVNLRSRPGHGTRMELLLPEIDAPVAPATPPQAAGFRAGGKTVLLVDDQEAVRLVVSRHFAALGFHVLAADSAEQALPLLQGGAPIDLLFSDIVLPGAMDGAALARLAVSLRPEMRVLLTSGFAASSPDGTGRFSLLRKPFLRRDLMAGLEQVFAAPPPTAVG
jgi:PAS domain S-box-containing protein